MSFMKYIVFKKNNFEEMVIFSKTMQHIYVANALHVRDCVVSAGQFICDNHEIDIALIGDSISIGVSSRPEKDRELFLEQFGD
jgi:hypothetical protein